MSGSQEDLVIVESNDYAQVVFDDVKECYSNTRQLECVYALSDLLKADASDWIGIYKVGFTNCNDHATRLPVDLEQIKENKGKVVFEADALPREDGEYYQFVYVSQSKQIRGASVPFQFKQDVTEFVEDEEQDAVVIKYELNQTITEIKTRCEQLSKANETYENLVKENEDMIKTLKDEVAAIKLRCFRLTMDNEKLNFTLRNKADNLKNLAETITSLTEENNKLQTKFDDLSNENKSLNDMLQHRIDQIAQLKSELETVKLNKGELESLLNLKESELLQLKKDKDELNRIAADLQQINDQIVVLEKQVDERVNELNQIKTNLKKNEIIVSEQAETIQNILGERDRLTDVIQQLTREKGDLESNRENLSQELCMSKDKLLAAEQCKEMLRQQLISATEELNESNKQIDAHLITIKNLNDKFAQSELEKSVLIEKLAEVKLESDGKLEQVNGSYYALRLAHGHLEARLKMSEQKKEILERQDEIQKKTIESLEQENEELRERIKAGAKEYTKLFEKYRLLRNQQFNNDVNIYHDLSTGEVHLARRNQPRPATNTSPNSEQESDSAIQDKTVSQSACASSTDIENTLLDALLGTSFYNNTWNRDQQQNNRTPQLQRLNANNILTSSAISTTSSATVTTTTTQPKSQHHNHQNSDLSDDGLVHNNFSKLTPISQNTNNTRFVGLPKSTSQNQPLSQINPETAKFSCEICEHIFPTNVDKDEIERHYNTHYGPTCPVCYLQFYKGYSQTEFENHVNSHFSN